MKLCFRHFLSYAKGMSNNSRCMKVYGLLGLAAKKGSVISGWEACERSIKKGAGGILILAGDSAAGTKDKFLRLSSYHDIMFLVFGSRSELGRRTGKRERSVMIVTDINLARGIRELFGFTFDENNGGVEFGKNQGI